MSGKNFHDKESGQALSMDLLLALVVFTVFLGVSANAMDLVSSKMDENAYINSLERITAENADILLNTPGSPENWEEGLQPLSMVKPGLAQVDSAGSVNKTLNLKKVLKLSENYHELMDGKVLPFGLNSSMMVCPINSSLEKIMINDPEHPDSAVDILTINRTIMCDYMIGIVMASIVSGQLSGGYSDTDHQLLCPHCNLKENLQHFTEESGYTKFKWQCKPFNVTQNDINTSDIYIMTDPTPIIDESPCWILDSTQHLTDNRHQFTSSPYRLNDKLSELLGEDDDTTVWLHVLSPENGDESFDVYVGSFVKGTPSEKIKTQYLTPQPCYFVFKVWI